MQRGELPGIEILLITSDPIVVMLLSSESLLHMGVHGFISASSHSKSSFSTCGLRTRYPKYQDLHYDS